MMASSLTVEIGVAPFVFTYGAMFALGMGIAYTAPVKCVMDWVPERKGITPICVFVYK